MVANDTPSREAEFGASLTLRNPAMVPPLWRRNSNSYLPTKVTLCARLAISCVRARVSTLRHWYGWGSSWGNTSRSEICMSTVAPFSRPRFTWHELAFELSW